MNFESQIVGEQEDADAGSRSARRKYIIVVGAVLLVALLVGWMLFGRAPASEDSVIESVGPVVTVIQPGRKTVALTVNATGSLAARHEMPVGVVGEGGMVDAVLVDTGDWVASGQALARIERSVQSQQAQSLAASISVAQADARLAQSELERAQALVSRGFISKADIDRKSATRDAAVSRVRVAQAQLREQQARNGRLDVRAPADGLILARSLEQGQIVSSGSGVLFRIAQGGLLEMRAAVAETDIARISVGASARVTPVGSTKSYAGTVWQISPAIDPATRQGTVRIALSFDKDLRPGGFAGVEIVSGRGEMPVLPESAVQNDRSGSFVFVVNQAGRVERRNVSVGQVSDRGVSIRNGLTGTERVVILAAGFLTPGQKVQPQLQKSAR